MPGADSYIPHFIGKIFPQVNYRSFLAIITGFFTSSFAPRVAAGYIRGTPAIPLLIAKILENSHRQ